MRLAHPLRNARRFLGEEDTSSSLPDTPTSSQDFVGGDARYIDEEEPGMTGAGIVWGAIFGAAIWAILALILILIF